MNITLETLSKIIDYTNKPSKYEWARFPYYPDREVMLTYISQAKLLPREEQVLTQRFVDNLKWREVGANMCHLGTNHEATSRSLSPLPGCSPERARQVAKRAIQKLIYAIKTGNKPQ